MTNFFSDENYKIPSTSKYMKFLEGDNTFRVLSSAITGYEYWTVDNNPVRSKTPFDETPNIKMVKNDGNQIVPSRVNHFWAFAVWNYKDECVQVLELTQKGIMEYIKSLVDNKKWGNPNGYDITVNRKGSGFDTTYTCVAEPHSIMEDKIADAWSRSNIDLNELYTGGDPFNPSKKEEKPDFVAPKVEIKIDDGSVEDPKF
jgi:hypothetical protein